MVIIMVLSVGAFFAIADQDYRLRHADTTVSIAQYDQARDFENLTAHEREIFQKATKATGYVSEDPVKFPDRIYRGDDTYYDFAQTTFYDWTDLRTVFPILTLSSGLLGVVLLLRQDA